MLWVSRECRVMSILNKRKIFDFATTGSVLMLWISRECRVMSILNKRKVNLSL
jgi:hypothetical protein